ncbi:MAG: alpha/beta hydrolase [Devosia sp.]
MRNSKIKVEDVELAATIAGDPSKPGLVLLHGWPQSRAVYDGVVDALGEDFFVLAFDLPEIGGSRGAPKSAEKRALADIVISAAESAGAKSIIVAGFDVGGMIAFAAAREHGARIAGAVAANTVIPGADPWSKVLANPHIWHFAFHTIPGLPETLVDGHQRAYFDFFFDFLAGNPKALGPELRDKFAAAYERPAALTAGFDWYRALEADAKLNGRHKRITTPMLYLRGDADSAALDEYAAGLKAVGVENLSTGIIHKSGEFLPVEAPDAFVDALRQFGGVLRQKAKAAA